MAELTIEGKNTIAVPDGTRLLVALLDAGVDILHRCGGYAKCTTCRVRFHEGEPSQMTVAEHDRLTANDQLGEFRLSCQCLAKGVMRVEPLMSLASSGFDDPGPDPETVITPEPEWRDAPVAGVGRSAGGKEAPTGVLD